MTEELEQEDISAQLASQQQFNLAAQKFNQTIAEGQQFNHPSYLKYGFLFAVAGIVDMVDLADVTGIGIIISKIVSIAGTAVIYLILFLANGKMKRAQAYGESLEASLAAFSSQAARIDRLALRGAKALGKVPGLKGLSREARLTRVKIIKFARKNPYTKVLLGGAVNLVPYLAIINLMVFWVYISYRDEKKTYQQTKESAISAVEQTESV